MSTQRNNLSKSAKCLRIAVLLLLSTIASTTVMADDGGAWISLQANKGWQKGYGFVRLEFRSNQNFGQKEALFGVIGGGVKATPWLKTDLSYEYWNTTVSTHKAVFSATETLTRDALSISLREKLEFAYTPSLSTHSFTLRTRLRAQYNIPGSMFRPYAMAEVFSWKTWIRSLNYVGTEIAFNQHNVLDIFYMYHLPGGGEPVHVIGVGYVFNF